MSIEFEVVGSTARITLNRPGAMNAVTREMDAQLRAVWSEVNARREVCAVVITGA